MGPLVMRVAIFSDIHGNIIALDAVLKDIESQGGSISFGFWVIWLLSDHRRPKRLSASRDCRTCA
jgi:hypothetical protein